MKAIDLFPYWADNRGLLAQTTAMLRDEDLEARPAPGLRSLGEVLRHIISAEERWWHGGICGQSYAEWRPEGWERWTGQERDAWRTQRFPTVGAILEGLRAAHEPVDAFLRELDAADLCEKRRATWGEHNTLRWILWHLVEHDQHHRAQVFTRMRWLQRGASRIWPRTGIMGRTPAGEWRTGEIAITDVVPFWKPLHASLREAVGRLTDADLGFTHAPGRPTIHDLVLHIFVWEDFLIRQNLGKQIGTSSGRIEGWFWRSDVSQMADSVGAFFPTIPALIEGLDHVHAMTRAALAALDVADLPRTIETPVGPETVHHLLWYAREHAVHHRAQLFFRMRMLGRTPPEI